VEAILAANTSQNHKGDTSESTHLDDRRPAGIPSAPEAEIVLDEIEEERMIGQGGNADVIEGRLSTADGTVNVAVKKPRMSGTIHAETIERMLEEAKTWNRLDGHDHVVGVVDWGSSPVPWIGMEYMDGGHLGDRAAEMGITQKLWTALAITRGVRHAHRHGVVHLDLKPENVLFRTVEGAWDVPKVADWGLSKRLLEHSKSVEGLSPQYAAPEQFDDDYGASDHSTDIYQLGAVFYELFTGRPPFDTSPSKAMYQILETEPTVPSEVVDVPARVDDILLKALSKRKDERYDDVLYLRDALRDALNEH
jgi:molecular chaperone DnaK